jgi:hypothetical protein
MLSRELGWIIISIINCPMAQFLKKLTVFLWGGGKSYSSRTTSTTILYLQTSSVAYLAARLFETFTFTTLN